MTVGGLQIDNEADREGDLGPDEKREHDREDGFLT